MAQTRSAAKAATVRSQPGRPRTRSMTVTARIQPDKKGVRTGGQGAHSRRRRPSTSRRPRDPNPARIPDYNTVTRNGVQSPLVGLFNSHGHPTERAILSSLTNDDMNNLRATCRVLRVAMNTGDDCGPAPGPHLLHQHNLIDRCHEDRLPPLGVGPPIPICLNGPQSVVKVRWCQYRDCGTPIDLRHPHRRRYPDYNERRDRPRPICEICRGANHYTYQTSSFNDRNGLTRYIVLLNITPVEVCNRCDARERLRHPGGFDGCQCYQNLYQRRWLCRICEDEYLTQKDHEVLQHRFHRDCLEQRGKTMYSTGTPHPQGLHMCPCKRRVPAQYPPPQAAQNALPHLVHVPPFIPPPPPWYPPTFSITRRAPRVQQCCLCCEYIIPPSQHLMQVLAARTVRHSGRAAGRGAANHVMLGARNRPINANPHGFPG